jgi:hypothetical protein
MFVDEVDDVLPLPRPHYLAELLAPLALRALGVEFVEVGELLARREDPCRQWYILLQVPLIRHVAHADCGEQFTGDVLLDIVEPARVEKLDLRALDDQARRAFLLAFDFTDEVGEAIESPRYFAASLSHS